MFGQLLGEIVHLFILSSGHTEFGCNKILAF